MARFIALTAVMAGAALAACSAEKAERGAAGAPAGEAAAIDVCALLTIDEINAAMGGTLSGGAPGADYGGGASEGKIASCSWGTDAEPAMFVTLQTYSWSDAVGARNYMATMRASSETEMSVPVTDVAGLGEEAFESGFGLVVRKGGVNLVVKADGVADEAGAQEALAGKALARLP